MTHELGVKYVARDQARRRLGGDHDAQLVAGARVGGVGLEIIRDWALVQCGGAGGADRLAAPGRTPRSVTRERWR